MRIKKQGFKDTFKNSTCISMLNTLYGKYNGQLRDWVTKSEFGEGCSCESALWNVILDDEIIDAFHFYSISGMIDSYEEMNDLVSSGDDDYSCEGADAGIEPVFWSANWIPFGTSASGDYLCLDQKSKCVIYVCHEGSPRRIVAKNFEKFLDNWNKMLSDTVIITSNDTAYVVQYKDKIKTMANYKDFPWDIVPRRYDIQAFHVQHGFFSLDMISTYFD